MPRAVESRTAGYVGHLSDAECALNDDRAWLLLAIHVGRRRRHWCLICLRAGVLEGSHETDASDGSWLGALGGKCAAKGVLFAPTEAGIARVELRRRRPVENARFVDAEPFVSADSRLFVSAGGLCVVRTHTIERRTMS